VRVANHIALNSSGVPAIHRSITTGATADIATGAHSVKPDGVVPSAMFPGLPVRRIGLLVLAGALVAAGVWLARTYVRSRRSTYTLASPLRIIDLFDSSRPVSLLSQIGGARSQRTLSPGDPFFTDLLTQLDRVTRPPIDPPDVYDARAIHAKAWNWVQLQQESVTIDVLPGGLADPVFVKCSSGWSVGLVDHRNDTGATDETFGSLYLWLRNLMTGRLRDP
jgi:hypothetical protein